tara:strand:+ start:1120 stop:1875 length:756 start_codon:yes stop_codon:yes gene_type:complete
MESENRFIILTPLYNVQEWIKFCIRSVKVQKYQNYNHYLINDISTDNTSEVIQKEIEGVDNFNLINNEDKKYALKNIEDTLEQINPNDEDIIVILDGDDWLASPNVFSTLSEIYNKEDCWMTYGSYVEYPSNTKGKFAKQIPDNVIRERSYREAEWMSSHLRTFKYKLWKKIDKNDFIFSQTGKHIKAAWDLAFVFPMLEMAGHRAKYVEDVLYIYNRQNPLNEDKINHPVQLSEEREVRLKDKYDLLENL